MALALSVAMFFSHGIGFYVVPVVLKPLGQEFGWGMGAVSGMVAIYALARGVTAPGVGRLCDRYGARAVVLLSAPLFGLALVLLSFIQSLWQLYAIYFLVSVAAGGLQAIPISSAISAWFVRRRGTAMALALAGMNLGGLVLAPLAAYLLPGWGWRGTFVILGILSGGTLLPLLFLVVRSRPQELGLAPDGEAPLPLPTPKRAAHSTPLTPPWRSPAFWLVSFSFFLVTGSFVGVLTHQVVYLSEAGIAPVMAAAALGLTSGFGILGKLGAGFLGDRLSKVHIALLCFAFQGAGVLLLMGTKDMAMVWLYTAVFGAAMAATPLVYPLVVAEIFGEASLGSTFGLTTFFSSFGTAAGAPLAGYIYDRTGSYYPAFAIFLLAYGVAILCLLLARRWKQMGK